MKIIEKLRRMLHENGLLFCPDLTVDFDKKIDTVRRVKMDRKKPFVFAGRPYEEVTEKGVDLAFELVKKYQKDKVRTLTDFDVEVLTERGLDPAKASIFKPYWYKGKTSKETERDLKKNGYGYGYGSRTGDKYFSAFSSALLSEKGIDPK
jgi:hypothetical protein